MKLSDSHEDALIQRVTQHLHQRDDVLVGPGDDCAVITQADGSLLLLKTDCVVESVHFLPEADAERVGWKALARVVSDIAAMGGTPTACVITLILRPDTSVEWLDALYSGIQRCATDFELSIVGGETSSAPPLAPNIISVAGTGSLPPQHLVKRSTSQPGDAIFVTGSLGGSIHGKHLDFTPRLEPAQWLVKHHKPSAMMDLSDGLAKDLPRLAQLSQTHYQLDLNSLPLTPSCTTQQALADGEDYELLFTLPPSLASDLQNSWPSHFPPLTQIGHMTTADSPSTPLNGGWEHFSS
ncbi:thiamine-phosphate kinase [Rubritalea tangerina]|uniref:Thiamine-monophosphate kinase n=1 Tax=Rubritalea tangerina TaxID=430798 RepID=A0ABW4ZCT3_9BACT